MRQNRAHLGIIEDGQSAEEPQVLKGSGHTGLHHLVRFEPRDLFPFVDDGAGAGRVNAGNQVEEGRLSCSVGADNAQDLPFADLKAKIVDRHDSTEVHGHVIHLEDNTIPL